MITILSIHSTGIFIIILSLYCLCKRHHTYQAFFYRYKKEGCVVDTTFFPLFRLTEFQMVHSSCISARAIQLFIDNPPKSNEKSTRHSIRVLFRKIRTLTYSVHSLIMTSHAPLRHPPTYFFQHR